MKKGRREPAGSEKVSRSEEVRVVSSEEENPRRETEVDREEDRASLGDAENDESIRFEEPLRTPLPTDHPRDISPATETDGKGLGMVDQPDAATIAEYEAAEQKLRRDRRSA